MCILKFLLVSIYKCSYIGNKKEFIIWKWEKKSDICSSGENEKLEIFYVKSIKCCFILCVITFVMSDITTSYPVLAKHG